MGRSFENLIFYQNFITGFRLSFKDYKGTTHTTDRRTHIIIYCVIYKCIHLHIMFKYNTRIHYLLQYVGIEYAICIFYVHMYKINVPTQQ